MSVKHVSSDCESANSLATHHGYESEQHQSSSVERGQAGAAPVVSATFNVAQVVYSFFKSDNRAQIPGAPPTFGSGMTSPGAPRNEAPASLRTWEGSFASQAGVSVGRSREISLAAQRWEFNGAEPKNLRAFRGRCWRLVGAGGYPGDRSENITCPSDAMLHLRFGRSSRSTSISAPT
jgi:hypothetical protein